ncbi:hypothetical protein SAMN05216490_2097 [Mucilaginibacter mallensis]|uniref:Uncharacterized protein n=1 Tax=Mucilaginibacter mallensis TaxID=652787 RepID=A0A1H1W4F6_MUCMA|nr:hypothetical protein [Mucilaginibacter mallensis]SDS92178.1 hypothetical protein SAMN05216490_2097 [Mucilaginibacter mallensis]
MSILYSLNITGGDTNTSGFIFKANIEKELIVVSKSGFYISFII